MYRGKGNPSKNIASIPDGKVAQDLAEPPPPVGQQVQDGNAAHDTAEPPPLVEDSTSQQPSQKQIAPEQSNQPEIQITVEEDGPLDHDMYPPIFRTERTIYEMHRRVVAWFSARKNAIHWCCETRDENFSWDNTEFDFIPNYTAAWDTEPPDADDSYIGESEVKPGGRVQTGYLTFGLASAATYRLMPELRSVVKGEAEDASPCFFNVLYSRKCDFAF
ncbi:hypothetical protein J6590_076770 [Homalodisca vitripennis]|nr:hypothetical protein J6590_076770 [Homalodisca vitripennis]